MVHEGIFKDLSTIYIEISHCYKKIDEGNSICYLCYLASHLSNSCSSNNICKLRLVFGFKIYLHWYPNYIILGIYVKILTDNRHIKFKWIDMHKLLVLEEVPSLSLTFISSD